MRVSGMMFSKKMAFLVILNFSAAMSVHAENKDSQLNLDEVVSKFYNPAKPINYETFRDIGFSDFRQVSSSRSLNIAFRSAALKTKDQYGVSFVEFRV
ncbi:hypothetical protein ACE8FU_22000, partial [Xanthomonas euvesicatoria pv. euvesicatoria]